LVLRGKYLEAYAIDGSRSVRLARIPRFQDAWSGADLSPDGSRVAFARTDGGISTMRIDGSDRRVVTRGYDHAPTWGADGKTLYLVRGVGCGNAIIRVAASGGPVHGVTNPVSGHANEDPAVSPDMSRIAFTDWDQCGEGGTASPRLRVVAARGRTTTDLARLRRNGHYPDPEHCCPTWSPNGTRLAYRLEADLAVANRDGSRERRIARGGTTLIYVPPKWSPNGRWIAFARDQEVIIVHPDGSELRRIMRGGGQDPWPVGWLPTLPN